MFPSADRKKWSRWRRPTKAQRIIRWKGVRDNDDVNAKESEVPETAARPAQGQGLARRRTVLRRVRPESSRTGVDYGPANRSLARGHHAVHQARREALDPDFPGQAVH